MKIFNEKLKLINEDYPLTLPPWLILGGRVISGAFILTKITLTVWFCLKHRKSMTTLLKIALPLARKIQNDPKTIEHLVQRAGEVVTTIVLQDHHLPLLTVLLLQPNLLQVVISILPLQHPLLFPLLCHQEPIDEHLNLSQKLHRNNTLKDNYVSNPMLDILRKNVRKYKHPQKVIYKLFPIFSMYIHKQYS